MAKNLNQCLKALMGPKPDEALKKEAKGIMQEFQARVGEEPEFDDIATEIRQVAEEIFADKKIEMLQMKRRAQLTKIKEDLKDLRFERQPNILQGFLEMTEGRGIDGKLAAAESIIGRQKAAWGEMQGMIAELGDDLFHKFRQADTEFQMEIADAIDGKSKDPEAIRIANWIAKLNKKMVMELNKAGANIKYSKTRVGRRIHDEVKIANKFIKDTGTYKNASKWKQLSPEMGFDSIKARNDAIYPKWFNYVMKIADADKTFKGKDPNKVMRPFFDDIMSSVHTEQRQGSFMDKLESEDAPKIGSLAKRLSKSKKLILKDMRSEVKYMNDFGNGTMFESLASAVTEYSRAKGILDIMGPGGGATYKRWVDEAISKNRQNLSPEKAARASRVAEIAYNRVTGVYSSAVNSNAAFIESAILSSQIWGKLGAVLFTSIGDKGLMVGNAFRRGSLNMKRFAQLLSIVPRTAHAKRRAAGWGVGFKGFGHSYMNKFNPNEFKHQFLDKMNEGFMNMTGMTKLNEANAISVAEDLSGDLAAHRDLTYDKLPLGMREALVQFDIQDAQWDVIRQAARKEADGEWRIMPENIPAGETKSKIFAFFASEVDNGVLMPDGQTMRFMYGQSQPGSMEHIIRSFFGQFKSFPITIQNKIISRYIKKADAQGMPYSERKVASKALEGLIAMSTSMGFIWMADIVKHWSQNRNQSMEELTSAAHFKAIVMKTGGLGIYGDILFKEYDRGYKHPLVQILAGPAVSEGTDAMIAVSQSLKGLATEGEIPDSVKRSALQQFKRNIPFNNAPVVKPLLDEFIWNTWNELYEPYLDRLEKSMNETGETKVFN